jgi:hypothetical protein
LKPLLQVDLALIGVLDVGILLEPSALLMTVHETCIA